MDAKITLSFDQEIIANAKTFAENHNISLSRLTEFLYSKIVSSNYPNLEELPISEWVNMVAEGEAQYNTKPKSREALKNEYYESRR